MRDLYILGAGGFGLEVAWLVERVNEITPVWNLKGFIDDKKYPCNFLEYGYPIMGTCKDLINSTADCWIVCAIGSAKVRKSLVSKLAPYTHIHFVTLIDPAAQLSKSVKLGVGTIICAGTIVTVDVSIGDHVIINLDCTLGHDAHIENFVTIYPSVNVSGNVLVSECAELGTGARSFRARQLGQGVLSEQELL